MHLSTKKRANAISSINFFTTMKEMKKNLSPLKITNFILFGGNIYIYKRGK